MRVRNRVLALAAVVLVAALAALAAAASGMLGYRTGGPLSGFGAAGVDWPAKVVHVGDAAT
jgi:hypothetical protein